MNENITVLINSAVFAQEVDGEIVLLDMNSENYFGLDSVATDIWQLLNEGKTLEETHAALLAIYEVDEAQLKEDLETFIQKLVDDGLVTLA
jgi:ornithine carbamoyltransferase